MPWLSPHPCRYPGCGVLIKGSAGYCQQHRSVVRQRQDESRPSASTRGYDSDWRRRRARYLAEHPDCARCSEPATVVDHVLPLSAGGADDESNYQSLCKTCHDSWKQAQDRKMRRPGGR
jgi:5-methylcytosine-specific restriction endonuclease McrA